MKTKTVNLMGVKFLKVQDESEYEMRNWLEMFLEDVNNIEIFFLSKYEEYSQEFEILKEMYIRKKQAHTLKKKSTFNCGLYQENMKQAKKEDAKEEIQLVSLGENFEI